MDNRVEILDETYRMICVIEDFCSTKQDAEEIYYIYPIIKYVKKSLDKLICIIDNLD